MIKSSQTFFTAISIYQGFLKNHRSEYLIFSDLKEFYKHKEDIAKNMKLTDKASVLIIEVNEDINQNFLEFFQKNLSLEIINNVSEYKYDDLTDDSKLKLLESVVYYQNKLIKLKDLLGIDTIRQLSDELKSSIDLGIFYKLLRIENDEEELNDENDIYIERTFYRFIKIDNKILEENRNDILAILDSPKLNKADLKYIKFGDLNSDKLLLDETKIIILSGNDKTSKDEFESLCKNSRFKKKNLHLLKYVESGELIWLKSFGNAELIRKHKLNSTIPKYLLEEEYFYNINEIDEQVIVISDEAGMGKSTFMTNLCRNLKIIANDSFVLKIDLNKYFKELKDYKIKQKEKKSKRSIDFLCNLNLFKTDLEMQIFKNLTNNEILLIILFDGLDEISPLYKEVVLDIVDDLKLMNAKIVITTRPHLKEELESHYGVISYQMTKFDYENQKNYLMKYWTLNSKVISFNDVEKKAEDVIEKISKSINDR
jgi:hypothetical protein